MVNPFICGSGTLHHQEEEDDELYSSPCSTPRKPRKICRSKDCKNPYADRGLDKFSALLAELEDKRQKIYTQRGSHDISLVRFVYSNSEDCKPVVVRMRDKNQEKNNFDEDKDKPEGLDEYPIESSASPNEVNRDQKSSMKKSYSWKMKMGNWRHSYCLPAVVILILLYLAVFGRSFAILCTSLGWYLVPTIKRESSNAKRPRNKKEYSRRASEKKLVSDGYIAAGAMNDRQRLHRKSW